MNKQGSKDNPAGGIEWTHFFGPGTGFTANPVRGCQHGCQWRMPDGKLVICYAKSQKERMYGEGSFENVTYHPEVFDAIRARQQPAGIFIDSMSDLFATSVRSTWIDVTLECMRDNPQHVFFSLTKNPTRLPNWDKPPRYKFPKNLFLGVSMPPTIMFGKELTEEQQRTWFDKALRCLTECEASVRWVSLEPLSWNCSDILAKYADKLHWAVIGAGSDGPKHYPPSMGIFASVLRALGRSVHPSNDAIYRAPHKVPVFYKGNLRSMFAAAKCDDIDALWREEFPKL